MLLPGHVSTCLSPSPGFPLAVLKYSQQLKVPYFWRDLFKGSHCLESGLRAAEVEMVQG